MILNSSFFISSFLFSLGLLRLQPSFFSFCIAAVRQMDILLSRRLKEAEKQRAIIKNLLSLLGRFGVFILQLLLLVLVALLPLFAYFLSGVDVGALAPKTWFNALVILVGGLLPFFIFRRKKQDYPAWHKLIHTLIMPNYNIHNQLFKLEKNKFKSQELSLDKEFVIVTGLARSGTTAFCEALYNTGSFYSLTYANMPFLLAPNWWKKVYNPKQKELKERAHGDGVKIGVSSPEALEEYFFKVQLNDGFYQDGALYAHVIHKDVYADYMRYQSVVGAGVDGLYLAKNNNFMLRYDSMRACNKAFKVFLMFREPVAHAVSLYRQHKRFCEKQANEPFVLDYMNWLGHHEFGLGHKRFVFAEGQAASRFEPGDNNYWLEVWLNYYEFVLSLVSDPGLCFVGYADFLEKPASVLGKASNRLGLKFADRAAEGFVPKDYQERVVWDEDLLERAEAVYARLELRAL